MKKNLLLVDDDKFICEVIEQGLCSDFNVLSTDDSDVAFNIASKSIPDAILLDIYLSRDNGIDLCKRLRANDVTRKVPVFIFTGNSTTENMLSSFEFGADDYLEKPIDLKTMKGRILSRIKRLKDLTNSGPSFGNLKIHQDRNEIDLDGRVQHLTVIEFNLLNIFLNNPNQKISREEILETVWSDAKVTERTVDVHVSSLRRKLSGFNHTIKCLYGAGYILKPLDKN